jgi:hypothetical protein
MHLIINGNPHKLSSKIELIEHLKTLEALAEVSIAGYRKTALVALLNEGYAMLLYMRQSGDHGFHTLNIQGDRNREHSFRLSSGKVDNYPEHWLCSREEGLKAIIHYFDTGHMTPELDWISQRSWSV